MLRTSLFLALICLPIHSAYAQNARSVFYGKSEVVVNPTAATNIAFNAVVAGGTEENTGITVTAGGGSKAYGITAYAYGTTDGDSTTQDTYSAWLRGTVKVDGLLDMDGFILSRGDNIFGLGNHLNEWKYVYAEDNIVRGMRDFSSLDLVQAIKASTPPAAKPELSFHSRKHLNVAGGFQELDPASLPVRHEGGGNYYLVSREFGADQYYDQSPLVGSDVMNALELAAPNQPVAGYFPWTTSGIGSWISGDSMKCYGPVNMKVE